MKPQISLTRTILGLIALAQGFFLSPQWGNADSPRILTVPSSRALLHVTTERPAIVPKDSEWRLVEVDNAKIVVAVQLVPGIAADGTPAPTAGRFVADIPPGGTTGKTRRFRIEESPAADKTREAFDLTETGPQSLKISEGKLPVLVYNHGTITGEKVPSKDNRRSRGCYIHPLWGVNGEVLTDDFPKDHYHHHGIFWAWPHVEVGGEQHDLWMYKDISQKFVRWLARESGPAAAVLGVENGWFIGDRKVMIERVWIQVAKATKTERIINLDFTWIPTDRPIALRGAEGKSYGGLTIRFAIAKPTDSTITVPAGTSKEDLPETRLPWADLSAKFAGQEGASGAAIFVPRDHPDYPPTWLTRHYGPLCVGWPGVKDKTFEPGKPIQLQYRVWIHSGTVGVADLESAYAAYLDAAKVRWE